MKNLLLSLTCLLCICTSFGQTPVNFYINYQTGLSDKEGCKDIVVEMPGKSAHDIYTSIAFNVGLIYNNPAEVMYGVEDRLVTVAGTDSNLCHVGSESWRTSYLLRFVIKDGKILILCPSVRLRQSSLSSQQISFTDFINQYWYNKATDTWAAAEDANMLKCRQGINDLINEILGITPLGILPDQW